MKKQNNSPIGIIAEDDSDVNSLMILVHKIAGNNKIGVKQFVGGGCGKIIKKCNSWANQLRAKGCKVLILAHDLDKKNFAHLKQNIEDALKPSPFENYLICIPTEEIEAWILSDNEAIKSGMNLKTVPQEFFHPEKIKSPKEEIEKIVRKLSSGEKSYINAIHNEKIIPHLSIEKAKTRCPSFAPFHDFIVKHFQKN